MPLMKQFIIIYSVFFSSALFAQKQLPIVQANSKKCYFLQAKHEFKSGWWLDVNANPDVFKMDKAIKAQKISFHTDCDQISTKLKPGQSFEFIVVLNGQDSCRTKIVSPEIKSEVPKSNKSTHDTIPFVLSAANNLLLKLSLNQKDSLTLYFHTASTGVVLTHEAIKNRTSLLDEYSPDFETQDFQYLSEKSKLQLGPLTWDEVEIMAISIRAEEADGSLGWDMFDGRIVEIDYNKSLLIVHSELPSTKGFTAFNLEFPSQRIVISGDLIFGNKKYPAPFILNSGYQRALLVDSVLKFEQQFPKDLKILKSTTLTNGAGEKFQTEIVNADAVKLKRLMSENVPAQLLVTDNPGGIKAHMLGNELLKRFNTIYDFRKNKVYFKSNGLKDLPYIDGATFD